MAAKAILSSKGQMVIPKTLRTKLGLHSGSELMIELKNNCLEIFPIKKQISSFFGGGKKYGKESPMSNSDIDKAIAQAVMDNDQH